MYSGCLGSPSFVVPKHITAPSNGRTCCDRPRCDPCAPQQATVVDDTALPTSNHASVSSPTGSSAANRSRGLVARKENRFPTNAPRAPHDLANPMHRRIVGSFDSSSAVEGLRPTNSTNGPDSCHVRQRRYLYLRSAENRAPDAFSRVRCSSRSRSELKRAGREVNVNGSSIVLKQLAVHGVRRDDALLPFVSGPIADLEVAYVKLNIG